MATIDLGRLGFVNKGTYNNSTTYEKNDLVQFTDGGILSTYLYIDSTAQSGQAPSSSGTAGSRWVYYAKGGAAGANGTDLGATLNNNEIAFKTNAGALDGLAIGAAGKILKVNSGANGYEFGDAGGGVLQIKRYHYVGSQSINSQQTYTNTNIAVAITPTVATSDFWIMASVSAGSQNHDANAVYNVHDSALGSDYNSSSQRIFTDPTNGGTGTGDSNEGYMSNNWSTGSDGSADNYKVQQSEVFGMYSPASNSASARTFTIICKTHNGSNSNGVNINGNAQSGNDNHSMRASSVIEVWEIANGIYT